jgi:hypothetical protein
VRSHIEVPKPAIDDGEGVAGGPTGGDYVPIPVNIVVSDVCDPSPVVTIKVYSDEGRLDINGPVDAVITRKVGSGDAVSWTVYLQRMSAVKCESDTTFLSDFTCLEADGRVYTVQVCAKNAAGLETCKEDTVGVPLVGSRSAAVGQGKLFLVAQLPSPPGST